MFQVPVIPTVTSGHKHPALLPLVGPGDPGTWTVLDSGALCGCAGQRHPRGAKNRPLASATCGSNCATGCPAPDTLLRPVSLRFLISKERGTRVPRLPGFYSRELKKAIDSQHLAQLPGQKKHTTKSSYYHGGAGKDRGGAAPAGAQSTFDEQTADDKLILLGES